MEAKDIIENFESVQTKFVSLSDDEKNATFDGILEYLSSNEITEDRHVKNMKQFTDVLSESSFMLLWSKVPNALVKNKSIKSLTTFTKASKERATSIATRRSTQKT